MGNVVCYKLCRFVQRNLIVLLQKVRTTIFRIDDMSYEVFDQGLIPL